MSHFHLAAAVDDSLARPTYCLPGELWTRTLHYLPRFDIRSCLSVSRVFHGVSLPFLFSSIDVSFGSKLLLSQADSEVSEQKSDTRTLEILDRISGDAAFASAIRTLRIFALGKTQLVVERRMYLTLHFPLPTYTCYLETMFSSCRMSEASLVESAATSNFCLGWIQS